MAEYKLGEQVDTKKLHKHNGSKPEWMIFWGVIALVLIVGTAIIAGRHTLLGWQATVFHKINNEDLGGTFVTIAKWITEGLGAAYPIIACVVIPFLFKKYRVAWRFFVTVGGAGVLADLVLKYIVNEPRPIKMLHGHNLHQRVVETGPGYPSGHAAVATALAITLWFYLPARWRFISIIWILLVAWSRLFLGVHTPADVVGGIGCGLLAVCVVRLLPKSISKPLRLDD